MVTTEVDSTFWGLCVEAGGKYSQKVENAFHISMAAVDPRKCKSSEPVTLFLQKNKVDYVLCTLIPGTTNQQSIDLNFSRGEDITLYVKEKGTVHLTGYLVDDDSSEVDFDELGEEEEAEEAEEDEMQVDKKMKQKSVEGKRKANEMTGDEVDSDVDDFDMDALSSDEDPEPPKKKQKGEKQIKKEQKQVKKEDKQIGKEKVNPELEKSASEGAPGEEKKKKKKKKKKNKNKDENSQDATKGTKDAAKEAKDAKPAPEKLSKKTLQGGVISQDLKEGHGPLAAKGKKVKVFYVGRLANGKVFDSNTSGKPFSFTVGKRDVIPGWDVGFEGMKVGGKRKLIVPPNMGYGNQKVGGIPPNSTLTFEVELKAVV